MNLYAPNSGHVSYTESLLDRMQPFSECLQIVNGDLANLDFLQRAQLSKFIRSLPESPGYVMTVTLHFHSRLFTALCMFAQGCRPRLVVSPYQRDWRAKKAPIRETEVQLSIPSPVKRKIEDKTKLFVGLLFTPC